MSERALNIVLVDEDDVDDGIVGLEEAVLLAREELVEGLAGEPGGLDHVADGRLLVALGSGAADHRLQQPLALGADRVGGGQCLRRARRRPWIRC